MDFKTLRRRNARPAMPKSHLLKLSHVSLDFCLITGAKLEIVKVDHKPL